MNTKTRHIFKFIGFGFFFANKPKLIKENKNLKSEFCVNVCEIVE